MWLFYSLLSGRHLEQIGIFIGVYEVMKESNRRTAITDYLQLCEKWKSAAFLQQLISRLFTENSWTRRLSYLQE